MLSTDIIDESKYEDILQNALIFPGGYISKEELSKISLKNTIRLYIFPGATNLFYQQGNQNSCIVSSLTSALYYMVDEYASKYIIKRRKNFFWKFIIKFGCTSAAIFLKDITEKKRKKT